MLGWILLGVWLGISISVSVYYIYIKRGIKNV